MDGTPTVWIIDKSDADGDGTVENVANGIIEPALGDKVRVIVGQRRGGRMYFALDVTPDSIVDEVTDTSKTTPEYMWRVTGGSGEYPKLGQSWSRPRVVDVVKGDDSYVPVTQTLVLVGGGYDEGTQDDGFGPGNTGNAIYAIHPITGEREFYVSGHSGLSPNPHGANVDGADMEHMQFPIPSDLAIMDSDADGRADRLYVGDVGGQMWRVDIAPSLDTATDDGATGGYDLTVGRLATVSFRKSEADVTTVTPAGKNRRKFFYPPDVVSVRPGSNASALGKYDLVTAVVGDRSSPLNLNVQNRFYAFADPDTGRMPDTDNDHVADDLGDSSDDGTFQGPIDADDTDSAFDGNLFDVTNDQDPTLTGDASKVNGSYYITFDEPGEKALAAPIVLAGKVFFTTFLPEQVIDAVTCTLAEGGGRLYGLDVLDGSAVFYWDQPETTEGAKPVRTYTLGSGIPSAAVPVFQPEKVTLLIGGGGGATTIDPGITLPRTRTYWFEQK